MGGVAAKVGVGGMGAKGPGEEPHCLSAMALSVEVAVLSSVKGSRCVTQELGRAWEKGLWGGSL